VAIFNTFPELVNDISHEVKNYFSSYYGQHWWSYMQFFMSVSGHVTPLHFDTLMTNNTFFQIKGKKRFILIPWDQRDCCYMKSWRWSDVDPSKPDLNKHIKFSEAQPQVVDVEGGDILFMPSGMLHCVETLSFSISFNIDWHSQKSVVRGVKSFMYGAPWKNVYYNMLIYSGLKFKVPEKVIYKYYRSYLGYIS
jgi:Cupin-like domain